MSSELATTDTNSALPDLVRQAAAKLAEAGTAAEVLEAREMATLAYDAAKRAARLGKAKQAHDELVAAAYRAQADALAIEAAAKRRLADEYDAAQERGEVAVAGDNQHSEVVPGRNDLKPSAADIGLSRKQVHEARMIRDAEAADPGIVERTATALVDAGKEPTRAAVKREINNTDRFGASVPAGAPKANGVRPPSPGKKKRGLSQAGKNAGRIERMRLNASVWKSVREALEHLTSLPRPEDVIPIAKAMDRTGVVDERLSKAFAWLEEFRDGWKQTDDN